MQLTVNGSDHEAPDNSDIPALLESLGLMDKPCAVEVNSTLIPKSEHATCRLRDGDTIELVTLVGGG